MRFFGRIWWFFHGTPHTGFSLGGFIAGALGLLGEWGATVNAVTFDAPGTSKFARRANKENRKMYLLNYVTQPNLVNTANKHMGEVRQVNGKFGVAGQAGTEFHIDISDLGIVSMNPQKVEDVNSAMSALSHTFKSHDLKGIIASAENNNEILPYKKVQKWPTANIVFDYAKKPGRKLPSAETNNPFIFFSAEVSRNVQADAAKLIWENTIRQGQNWLEGIVSATYACNYKITYTPEAAAIAEQAETPDEKSGKHYPMHANLNTLHHHKKHIPQKPAGQELDQSTCCLTQ